MTIARCTYCSASKRDATGDLPAVERYLSARISGLWERCQQDDMPMLILSGRYGLLRPEEPIPWYDYRLEPADVPEMATRIAAQLRTLPLSGIEYHTAPLSVDPGVAPYLAALQAGCQLAGIGLVVCELSRHAPPG